jgi:hypothetical protein
VKEKSDEKTQLAMDLSLPAFLFSRADADKAGGAGKDFSRPPASSSFCF